MTIRFILNGEDMEMNAEANQRLVSMLREHLGLPSVRDGCLNGNCGVCTVIFNGAVAASCLIPAFRVQGGEIITLEGFSQTDEYRDIAEGFAGAGVESCGYCDAGVILCAEALLQQNPSPSWEEFAAAFRGVRCRCTGGENLYRGVLAAGEARRRRIYGRSP
jgi:carbon-monoxide dehydrogenase small subunit